MANHQFTIKEIKPQSVVVDYSDGTWAEVPIDESSNDREGMIYQISCFAPHLQEDHQAKVPTTDDLKSKVSVGETIDIPDLNKLDHQHKVAAERALLQRDLDLQKASWEAITYDADQIRTLLKPDVNAKVEAIFQFILTGSKSEVEALDVADKQINSDIADDLIMTQTELNAMLGL